MKRKSTQQYDDDLAFDGLDAYDDSYSELDGEPLPDNHPHRWELEIESTLVQFKKDWKGTISERGIQEITQELRRILDKDIALSNLTSEEINNLCLRNSSTFNYKLMIKGKSWGLTPADNRSLGDWFSTAMFAHFKRAYKAGEKQHRQRASRTNISLDDEENHDSSYSLRKSWLPSRQREPNRREDIEL
jgi:hypothetical protein